MKISTLDNNTITVSGFSVLYYDGHTLFNIVLKSEKFINNISSRVNNIVETVRYPFICALVLVSDPLMFGAGFDKELIINDQDLSLLKFAKICCIEKSLERIENEEVRQFRIQELSQRINNTSSFQELHNIII